MDIRGQSPDHRRCASQFESIRLWAIILAHVNHPGMVSSLFPDRLLSLGQDAAQRLAAAPTRFDADDPMEASQQLQRVFSRHRLSVAPAAGGFCARYRGHQVGEMAVSSLSYGCEAALQIEPARDFLLVSLQLRGHGSVSSRGVKVEGGTGLITVDSSTAHEVSKHYSADSERLNVRIDRPRIERLLAEVSGRALQRPLEFEPGLDAASPAGIHWCDGLRLALGYLDPVGAAAGSALLVRRLEESLLLMLLTELPHNHSAWLHGAAQPPAPRHVRRAEEYIRTHAGDDLTLADIAQAAGTSVRSLTEGFRRFRDTTPMRYLRDVRLDSVRDALRHGVGAASVSASAARFGFAHAGRFAADYQRRFGERPSETLRRGR